MTASVIELQNVTVVRRTDPTSLLGLWGAKTVRALDGVSLVIRKGETLGVIGGSGSGKTTLAETVTLRRQVGRGMVSFQGQGRLKGEARRQAMRRMVLIRQDPRESLEMERTAGRQLTDLLRRQGVSKIDERIGRALEQVELPAAFLKRTPVQMSGGEQQRLAIARALVQRPVLIAADEPFSGVDPRLQQELVALLQRIQREEGVALLLVSQNLQLIRRMAHRVAVLYAGRLVELGVVRQVLDESLHPFTRLFLGQVEGALPPEEDLARFHPAGCPWAEHCPLLLERCRKEMPALLERAPGHGVACHGLE